MLRLGLKSGIDNFALSVSGGGLDLGFGTIMHLSNCGAVDNASEDVDQDALDLGVRVEDLKGTTARGSGQQDPKSN
jgi:hypothetical protein